MPGQILGCKAAQSARLSRKTRLASRDPTRAPLLLSGFLICGVAAVSTLALLVVGEEQDGPYPAYIYLPQQSE